MSAHISREALLWLFLVAPRAVTIRTLPMLRAMIPDDQLPKLVEVLCAKRPGNAWDARIVLGVFSTLPAELTRSAAALEALAAAHEMITEDQQTARH